MTWHPSEDDLQIWAKNALEDAYQQRHRPKCSREDFADGWMAALVHLRSRSSFWRGPLVPETKGDDGA
jgi:hypothetical protein